jgi:hypothetical protein
VQVARACTALARLGREGALWLPLCRRAWRGKQGAHQFADVLSGAAAAEVARRLAGTGRGYPTPYALYGAVLRDLRRTDLVCAPPVARSQPAATGDAPAGWVPVAVGAGGWHVRDMLRFMGTPQFCWSVCHMAWRMRFTRAAGGAGRGPPAILPCRVPSP